MPRFRPGFATIATTILLGLAFAFAITLVDTVLVSRRAGIRHQETLNASQIAEAGMHKAIFCLKATSGTNCGGTYGSSYAGQSNVSFGDGTFTITLSGNSTTKTVTSVGTSKSGRVRTIKAEISTVPPSDAMSFSYAMQVGEGGAHLHDNATINGTTYANGNITCNNNGTINGDAYVGVAGGSITGVNNCYVNYHAYADKILSMRVYGNAYYKNEPADRAGSTISGTKYPNSTTPPPTAMPEIDLDFWRTSAEAGGVINGNYAPADGSSLGPVRINGNLTLDNNIDVTVNGPIWVKGNITVNNNGTFTLPSAWGANSTVILADDVSNPTNNGKITLSNNVGFYGSGNVKSHILVVATSNSMVDTQPALRLENNITGAMFYAPNGVLRVYNNGGAKSLVGKRLYLDNNATVTYTASEMTGLNFSNSPGGTWSLTEGTWREY